MFRLSAVCSGIRGLNKSNRNTITVTLVKFACVLLHFLFVNDLSYAIKFQRFGSSRECVRVPGVCVCVCIPRCFKNAGGSSGGGKKIEEDA